MDNGLVTQLSKEIVKQINIETGKKIKGVVQYLSFFKQQLKDKTLYTVKLSDGTFIGNFLLYPNIEESFINTVKANDIIEVRLVKKDLVSHFMLCYDFKVIYDGVAEVIGSPIEYKSGAENPKGDEMIPSAVIDRALGVGKGDDNLFLAEASKNNYIEVESNGVKERVKKEPIRRMTDERSSTDVLYTEIANLHFLDRSWSIRGRVIKKNERRFYKNATREGSVFSILIKDETRAIQANFFNEVAEKYYNFLKEGRMYSFTDGEIKTSGRYNTTDNKFEIIFNEKSVIREIPDDPAISNYYFNFVTIQEITRRSENDTFDVIAIIEEVGPSREMNLKNGTKSEKRSIQLVDQTGYKIELNLWGDQARDFRLETDSIAIFHDVRVKEFNGGKSLSTSPGARITTKCPESPQYKNLILYRNSRRGDQQKYVALSEPAQQNKQFIEKLAHVEEASRQLINDNDNGRLYFSVVAYFVKPLNNLYYDSCRNENCMKKLIQRSDNKYFCEKCHQTYDSAKPRFMSSIRVADDTGSLVLSLAGEDFCQAIFGCSTEKLKERKEANETEYNEFVTDKMYQEFKIRIVAKKEIYNNDSKIKFQAFRVDSVDRNIERNAESLFDQLTAKSPIVG